MMAGPTTKGTAAMTNKCVKGKPLTRNEPCEYCGAKFGETCGYELQKLIETKQAKGK